MKRQDNDLVARITLSERPDDETLRKIVEFVKKRGCTNTEYSIDPNILGGIVIQIGDVVYDGSLRGRLERIRQSVQ